MKRFCYTLLTFCILLILIMIGLDAFVSRQYHNCKDRVYDGWNYIFYDTTYNDLVINGNSRAWVQYNPNILDSVLNINAYNLGIDGSGINRQMIKYNFYCSYHKYPKFLIQNIDIFSLAITKGYDREQFFPYFYNQTFLSAVAKHEQFSLLEKILPFYRYIGTTPINRLYSKEQILTNKGYTGIDRMWNSNSYDKIDTVYADLDTILYKEFRAFLQKQITMGTKVIFVYAPMYHGVTEKCVNMNEMYETYEQLAKEFDIPILNYNEASICYDTTYFYNATHLNKKGAEKFSEQLAHDIDSLGLLQE